MADGDQVEVLLLLEGPWTLGGTTGPSEPLRYSLLLSRSSRSSAPWFQGVLKHFPEAPVECGAHKPPRPPSVTSTPSSPFQVIFARLSTPRWRCPTAARPHSHRCLWWTARPAVSPCTLGGGRGGPPGDRSSCSLWWDSPCWDLSCKPA